MHITLFNVVLLIGIIQGLIITCIKGFNDFVNEFRIEEAKARLADKSYQNLTLEGIALEVGFASRTTFLRAFKKVSGISPNGYKQKLDANPDLPPA